MFAKERLLKILFSVLLLSLPISKGVATIAALLLVLVALLSIRKVNFVARIKQYPHVAALALLCLAYLLGMLYTSAENITEGLRFLKGTHRFLIFPIILLAFADHFKQHLQFYLNIFLVGLVATSVITLGLLVLPEQTVINLTDKFTALNDYPRNNDRLRFGLYSPFIDRIQFSNLLGIALISCFYLLIKTKLYARYVLVILLLFGTTILLGGRGGQLGLLGASGVFLVGVCALFLFPRLLKYMSKTAAISVLASITFLVIFVLPLGIYYAVPAVQKRYDQMLTELETYANDPQHTVNYEHLTTVRRIVSWQNHWEVIEDNPILGVGTGDYIPEVQKAYDQDDYQLPLNSHSQYLHIWTALGLWGLAVFLGILVLWLRRMAQPNIEYIYGLAFMSLYAISFIPDAVLLTQIDSMAFSIFFCLIGMQAKTAGVDERKASTPAVKANS